MAYDTELADRLRELLATRTGVTERAMFGGLAFMIDGHMAVAAGSDSGILLRCDPADTPELLAEPGAEVMIMNGREMSGWLRVRIGSDTSDATLARWVEHGTRYVATLPPK